MAQVICNDGTIEEEAIGGEAIDVRNCLNHGGVSGPTGGVRGVPADSVTATPDDEVVTTITTEYTTTQKWLAVIGITAICYFILYKAGSLK